MRYLLDTNICIYIAKRRPPTVLARFEQLQPGDIGMSVITLFELSYGAWKSDRPEKTLEAIHSLTRLIPVVPLDASTSGHCGRLRADLERKGRSIGAYDLLIAAQALSLDVIMVTNNVREFDRVPGLKMENWAV
ncbi:MAG: type II toxin-antitoxin system VapC family toxin [Bryobacteraceae bacterium]